MSIEIVINGKTYQAQEGEMLIEVTDRHGIDVPRLCYHPSLSIAANCRTCLVHSVSMGRAIPACATPVAAGMEIATTDTRAKQAQKDSLEFLLINHPLECPVCDQAGECELQDL